MKTGQRRTQATAALEWLKAGKPLTRLEGFRSLHIADLPRVISMIRKQGTIIDTEMVDHEGHYGKTKYAKYHFIEDALDVRLDALDVNFDVNLDAVERHLGATYRFIKDTPKVDTTEGEHDDAKQAIR